MDILDTVFTVPGLDMARAAYQRAHSSADRRRPREIAHSLAKQLSITGAHASRLVRVAQSWFGTIHSDQLGWESKPEKQLRDSAVRLVEQAKLSWGMVDVITTCVNQVHSGASMSPEQVRVQLVQWACEDECDCDSLKARGTDLVRRINQPASRKNRYLAFSKNPDATGCKSMMLKAEEQIINQIKDTVLAAGTEKLGNARREAEVLGRRSHMTINQAMADVVIAHMLGAEDGAGASSGSSQATGDTADDGLATAHQPALIAVLNQHEYVDGGYLADSFGNTFTLQEAAELIMADTGWLVIADKNANVVANFNIKNRVATQNQRMAAVIEQITCGWPGCHNLVKDSQIHHMHAYKHGGRTSQENLTGLCRYHNGRNDDDRNHPRNGHMERDPNTKRVGWRPPGKSSGGNSPPGHATGKAGLTDEKLQFNDLPIHNLDGRALINRALNPQLYWPQ